MTNRWNAVRSTLLAGLALTLLVSVLFVGTTVAIGKVPGTPVAKAPKGSITASAPTFVWNKARGATRYELRVYQGGSWLLKTTGIVRTSWTCSETLPLDETLTWKVRASNAGGSGPWSRSLSFTMKSPTPPPQVEPALLGSWSHLDYYFFEITSIYSLTLKADGTYRKQVLTDGMLIHGLLTEWGTHSDTSASIRFSDVRETWEPAADDPSRIPAYTNKAQPDYEWSYTLGQGGESLDTVDADGDQTTWDRVEQ
jgi:hypothetical protein